MLTARRAVMVSLALLVGYLMVSCAGESKDRDAVAVPSSDGPTADADSNSTSCHVCPSTVARPQSSEVESKVGCVDTAQAEAVVSGDFQAGPFQSFSRGYPEMAKLWWSPLSDGAGRILKIVALPVDRQAEAISFEYDRTASPSYDAEGKEFFPTVVELPVNGRWRLIARAGTLEGCFEVAL